MPQDRGHVTKSELGSANATHRTAAHGHADSPGVRVRRGKTQGMASDPVAQGEHPAAGLDTPWHSLCEDAIGRTQWLESYPTGDGGLMLKFPAGCSATLAIAHKSSLAALLEVADFTSWWRK